MAEYIEPAGQKAHAMQMGTFRSYTQCGLFMPMAESARSLQPPPPDRFCKNCRRVLAPAKEKGGGEG